MIAQQLFNRIKQYLRQKTKRETIKQSLRTKAPRLLSVLIIFSLAYIASFFLSRLLLYIPVQWITSYELEYSVDLIDYSSLFIEEFVDYFQDFLIAISLVMCVVMYVSLEAFAYFEKSTEKWFRKKYMVLSPQEIKMTSKLDVYKKLTVSLCLRIALAFSTIFLRKKTATNLNEKINGYLRIKKGNKLFSKKGKINSLILDLAKIIAVQSVIIITSITFGLYLKEETSYINELITPISHLNDSYQPANLIVLVFTVGFALILFFLSLEVFVEYKFIKSIKKKSLFEIYQKFKLTQFCQSVVSIAVGFSILIFLIIPTLVNRYDFNEKITEIASPMDEYVLRVDKKIDKTPSEYFNEKTEKKTKPFMALDDIALMIKCIFYIAFFYWGIILLVIFFAPHFIFFKMKYLVVVFISIVSFFLFKTINRLFELLGQPLDFAQKILIGLLCLVIPLILNLSSNCCSYPAKTLAKDSNKKEGQTKSPS